MESGNRRRQRIAWTAALAFVLAVASWAIGVTVLQSVLLASVVAAVGAAIIALDRLDGEPTLPPLDAVGRSEGTRREVSRLSWAMAGPDNRVGGIPYRRLRAIAVDRLRLRGVDVTDPAGDQAARELLGPLGYQHLLAEAAAPPTQRVFQSCIALLERLDGAATATEPAHVTHSSAPSTAATSREPTS
jgi:hypothetical protein